MKTKTEVFVNQIGYLPEKTKFAYATGLAGGEEFEILSKGTVSFSGRVKEPLQDRVAGEPVCCIDFSDFKQNGEYVLRVKNDKGKAAESFPFKIGAGLYNDIYFSTLNYF